jgi:hypothetical protein
LWVTVINLNPLGKSSLQALKVKRYGRFQRKATGCNSRDRVTSGVCSTDEPKQVVRTTSAREGRRLSDETRVGASEKDLVDHSLPAVVP